MPTDAAAKATAMFHRLKDTGGREVVRRFMEGRQAQVTSGVRFAST